MDILVILFLVAGTAVAFLFGLFSISSLIERKLRAVFVSALLFVVFTGIWFGGFLVIHPGHYALAGAVLLIAVLALLFFLPVGKTKTQRIDAATERVDERDVIFARAGYRPGTDRYDAYYRMRPEKQEIDDKIRGLAELLSSGGQYYDPARSEYVASLFRLEEQLVTLVDGPVDSNKREVDPEEMSTVLKGMALHLGAAEVGVARLNPFWVYSHVGRGPEPWGAEIKNDHPYVIAFSVEMDYAHVEQAPRIGISEETALQYLHAQRISIVLAHYIRSLGHHARAHVSGSNYQTMLPPVAYDAGLGELGRFGYIISPRFGARIRLGAVTTKIPLVPDEPIQFGVQNFCEKCKKCAQNCPPGAIPTGSKTMVRGVEKWQLDIEKCYHYWRVIGTDCGLCMKVCPFSHPDNLIHNILRVGIKSSSFARSVSLLGDDLFYGKRAGIREIQA
ncbi:MAG: reductive dehalogenase [Candidatus Zixiibacteriota bacterium]|nr:MAG: reductive dehalogenase [candidate division Zixibacteria bacterium]